MVLRVMDLIMGLFIHAVNKSVGKEKVMHVQMEFI